MTNQAELLFPFALILALCGTLVYSVVRRSDSPDRVKAAAADDRAAKWENIAKRWETAYSELQRALDVEREARDRESVAKDGLVAAKNKLISAHEEVILELERRVSILEELSENRLQIIELLRRDDPEAKP